MSNASQSLPLAHIAHQLPGRVRLRIPERRGDAAFFDELARALASWPGIERAQAQVTDKLAWGPTIAYSPDVWQSGAWGVYAAGTLAYELPSEFLPAGLGWSLSLDFGRWMFGSRPRCRS